MNFWWLAWSCPDCGAPGGAECDDSCPSGLAAHIDEFEADIDELERMPAAERRAVA